MRRLLSRNITYVGPVCPKTVAKSTMNKTNTMLIDELIDEIIRHGIRVEIFHDETRGRMYDLRSDTKSHMHMYEIREWHGPPEGEVWVTGRYDELDRVHTLDELLELFLDRYFAKGFGSDAWMKLAEERGLAAHTEHVKRTYYRR